MRTTFQGQSFWTPAWRAKLHTFHLMQNSDVFDSWVRDIKAFLVVSPDVHKDLHSFEHLLEGPYLNNFYNMLLTQSCQNHGTGTSTSMCKSDFLDSWLEGYAAPFMFMHFPSRHLRHLPLTSWKPQKGRQGAASCTKRCKICTKIHHPRFLAQTCLEKCAKLFFGNLRSAFKGGHQYPLIGGPYSVKSVQCNSLQCKLNFYAD